MSSKFFDFPRKIDTPFSFLINFNQLQNSTTRQQKLEGVVGKKKDSLYWFGKRAKEWKKIKVMADYEAIAIGYVPKQNNMNSLILAKYDYDDQLVITNHVTLGVSLAKLREQGMQNRSNRFLSCTT